jgi:hypothetical protein
MESEAMGRQGIVDSGSVGILMTSTSFSWVRSTKVCF